MEPYDEDMAQTDIEDDLYDADQDYETMSETGAEDEEVADEENLVFAQTGANRLLVKDELMSQVDSATDKHEIPADLAETFNEPMPMMQPLSSRL